MKPDLTLRLGSFAFADKEVPQSIKIGGSQILAVHQLVGGKRIIDSLGPQPEPLSWSGWFVGASAQERVLYLDQLRAQGKELAFSFGQLSYRVVIAEFVADFQRHYQFQYSIKLEVVEAGNLKKPAKLSDAVNDLLGKDANTATGLAKVLNDTGITAAVNTVRSAVASATDLAKATTAEVNAVLEPIRQARALVQEGMDSVNSIAQDVTTLGGILPDNPVSVQAEKLLQQTNAMVNSRNMFLLDSVLARMELNVQNANASNKAVTVSGGNLYDISSIEYGDPMAWTTIARANGLTDPFITGTQTLQIPAQPDGSGGVLNV